MVVITPEPAALSASDLSLFYTTDDLLSDSPVLIFYGPTATSTQATHSRIQAHVFTPAGLHNFARLIISPTASFYSAVSCLPREEQGDEICRGLAFSLYKYYAELTPDVKRCWEQRYGSHSRLPSAPQLFSDAHAALVAAKMVKVENVGDVIVDIRHALGEQTLSWLDLDLVLPVSQVLPLETSRESAEFEKTEDELLQLRYGECANIVKLLGEPAFLPTSRLRRAPSRPSGIGRGQSFAREHKETLRREMCELLDTEENYVSKIYDLVNTVAVDFRQKARSRDPASTSPSEQTLEALFPPSLDKILEVNSAFLEAIRHILEDTENDAIMDIEQTTGQLYIAPLQGQKASRDVTGAATLAQALIEWFPKFGDCYADYMVAHADFSQLLKSFTKDIHSSFSKRVQETGEQRLMSMLIEPVQRLPRYNLYIDSIVKQLPFHHPALRNLLKARDIISEICSRDVLTGQHVKTSKRLQSMVYAWPPAFLPEGRLVTAIDFVELPAPYHGELDGPSTTPGIWLLFSDFLVMLQKPLGCTATARSLMAEIDGPVFADVGSGTAELVFSQHMKLSEVFVSEHSEGSILQLLAPTSHTSRPGRPRSQEQSNMGIRMFYLQGAHEGKARKVLEDISKARVEGRFPETERDSGRWEARSVASDLNLFTAVCPRETPATAGHRGHPAKVQIMVKTLVDKNDVVPRAVGVDLLFTLSILDGQKYQLDGSGLQDYTTRDMLTGSEFLPVLTKRIANYLQLRNQIRNPELTDAYMFRNHQILKSLKLDTDDATERQVEKSRPHSPVKMLSNLFGGSVSREGGLRRGPRNPPTWGELSRNAPPLQPSPTRAHSRDGELSRPTSSSHNSSFDVNAVPTDPLAKLEDTLATMLMAIHARKGNIVGRSVRARAAADELAVNEVYNAMLENPRNLDVAAQASVDVLFAAFEKFLKNAWREKMGPMLSQATLISLQTKSDSMYPGEFEDSFRMTLNDLAPQHQRSLQAIIRLLSELLDDMSNDGDRGILTAAFAEILVTDAVPNEYISLVDRLVQDVEVLFSSQQTEMSRSNFGSIDSRGRSTAAGSLSSNTSLRKRFGFGTLTRENSKTENESKVGSIWRTLSKNSHGTDSAASSISKAGPPSLNRSNSTDAGPRPSPKRPVSRDRPTVLGAFNFEQSPGRSLLGGLGTIGESEVPASAGPPRKKRRSSLSDLKTLQDADNAPTWSPQTPRRPESSHRSERHTSASPHTPASRSTTFAPKQSAIPTPSRGSTPLRKGNSPSNTLDRAGGTMRGKVPPARIGLKDEVTIKAYSPVRKRTDSSTGIPTLKATSSGLSERPTSGNTMKLPPTVPRSPTKAGTPNVAPRKLKMQSPQKLRERLQNQQRDIESASKDLQSELSLIGQELSARSTPRLTSHTSDSPALLSPSKISSDGQGIDTRVAALDKLVKSTLDILTSRSATIASDVATSLQVSENRAKHLDQLYRDMNAENEALYARFNDELEKVEKSVRQGKGGEELGKRLKVSEEEAARLRRENARLKREVAGLRAQVG